MGRVHHWVMLASQAFLARAVQGLVALHGVVEEMEYLYQKTTI